MTGGSLTAAVGPAFYVTNTKAIITLKGDVQVSIDSGILLYASAGNWGRSGSNGGTVTFAANGETLIGNLITDTISSITATLENHTALTAYIDSAALTLDSTSTWNVTADSVLTSLTDTDGISGNMITSIYGNGYTVYYDVSLNANSALGGSTYSLANGGKLTPKNSVPELSIWPIPALVVIVVSAVLLAAHKKARSPALFSHCRSRNLHGSRCIQTQSIAVIPTADCRVLNDFNNQQHAESNA